MYKKMIKKELTLCILSVCLFSCKDNKGTIAPFGVPEQGNIIAELNITENGDTVVSCDIEKVSYSFSLKISDLIDSLEIIKLDATNPDYYVKSREVSLSDNYIGIKTENQYKLFDKKGKFVSYIGRKGQGPGEYSGFIYDSQIDEENNRIYLIEMGNVSKILVYDLSGNYVEDIPLAYKLHKGRIKFNDKTLTIISLPWRGDETPLVWVQDFKGNLISETWKNEVAVHPEFSSEIYSNMLDRKNDSEIFIGSVEPRCDTLYNYSTINGLSPKFTVNYYDMKIPLHTYYELPHHYIIELYDKIEMGIDYTTSTNSRIIIDKKTLRGGYFDLILDPLGGILYNGYISEAKNGYFVLNIDPGDLKDIINDSKSMLKKYLNERDIQKLQEVDASISYDDNNYIIIGKWK